MSRPSRHTDPCASALGGRSAERSCATPAGCGLSKLGLPVERSKDIRLSSISDSCPFWFGVGFCERPRGRSKRIFAETSSLYSIRNSYIYIYIYAERCAISCPGFPSPCCGGNRLPTTDPGAHFDISSLANRCMYYRYHQQHDEFFSDVAVRMIDEYG